MTANTQKTFRSTCTVPQSYGLMLQNKASGLFKELCEQYINVPIRASVVRKKQLRRTVFTFSVQFGVSQTDLVTIHAFVDVLSQIVLGRLAEHELAKTINAGMSKMHEIAGGMNILGQKKQIKKVEPNKHIKLC